MLKCRYLLGVRWLGRKITTEAGALLNLAAEVAK
jgi:hypothetical protein